MKCGHTKQLWLQAIKAQCIKSLPVPATCWKLNCSSMFMKPVCLPMVIMCLFTRINFYFLPDKQAALFKDRMLKTSSGCSTVWDCVFYLINWQVHLQLAIFLHLCCSCHLSSFVLCIEHAALWEKWLITITSSAGSRRLILLHTLFLSLCPSIPLCPPVLSLFLSCTTSQEINVAVKPFIYLEWSHRRKGHGKPQLPCHKYGQPAWTSSLGLDLDSDRLLLMHVGKAHMVTSHCFCLVNKFFFCRRQLDPIQGGMWIMEHTIESASTALGNSI